MEYSVVASFIRQNWEPVRAGEHRRWISDNDLRASSPETLRTLLLLYAEGVLGISNAELEPDFDAHLVDDTTRISEHSVGLVDLAKFLRVLTLSEYRLDSLMYHPRKLRDAAIQDYAAEIGWAPDLLSNVYLWWHNSNRSRVMSADSSS